MFFSLPLMFIYAQYSVVGPIICKSMGLYWGPYIARQYCLKSSYHCWLVNQSYIYILCKVLPNHCVRPRSLGKKSLCSHRSNALMTFCIVILQVWDATNGIIFRVSAIY